MAAVKADDSNPEAATLGSRILHARKTYGLSQLQLGAHLEVTRAAVSLYEKDTIRPRWYVIERLAELFNADPEWFEHGRGRAPDPLDKPLTLPEINIAILQKRPDAEVRELGTGREWSLPLATFSGTRLPAHDHLVVITAPNKAGSIWKGDKVVIDTQRRKGEGVALCVSDTAGVRLVAVDGDQDQGRIIGYATAYLRTL